MKAIILGAIGAVLGGILGFVLVKANGLPDVASDQANNTDWVYNIMFVVTGAIFGLVTAVLLVAVIRFRARHGETRDAAPIHGHTGLEIVWTIIPTIIVIIFTGLSWKVLSDNDVATAKGRLAVKITARQFSWGYEFPELKIRPQNVLVVPVNTPIKLEIVSADVIHGFWVPDWRIGMNATPGQSNFLSVTPNRIGEVKVVCTFICGSGHPIMGSDVKSSVIPRIKVVSLADWTKWRDETLAQQAKDDADPTKKGVVVFNSNGCAGCHAWTPAGSSGAVGPGLDGVADDAKKAGKPVSEYLAESIVNPSAYLAPDFPDAMPKNYGTDLSKDDLAALVKALAAGGTQ